MWTGGSFPSSQYSIIHSSARWTSSRWPGDGDTQTCSCLTFLLWLSHVYSRRLAALVAAAAAVTLVPETLTVLRGDEARLTCSTSSSQWTVMVWLLNAEVVLTISNESGLLPSVNSDVTAERRSGSSWTFILKNSTRLNQGQVTCDLQGIGRRSADLFVEGGC